MSISNSAEWFDKSEIDYFSAFVKLWLSFNAFYRKYYISNTSLKTDRQLIEELKNTTNIIKSRFKEYYVTLDSNDAIEFRFYFQELVREYDGGKFGNKIIKKDIYKGIKPKMNGIVVDELSFKDFIHPRNYSLKSKNINGYIKIENLYISNDIDSIWPIFLEFLYIMRNQLIHGILAPTELNHKTIKNCYIVLRHLIKNEV